jgi:hypothetical protein
LKIFGVRLQDFSILDSVGSALPREDASAKHALALTQQDLPPTFSAVVASCFW